MMVPFRQRLLPFCNALCLCKMTLVSTQYCAKDTGGTCRLLGCARSRGDLSCIDGKCMCNTGFCSDVGNCVRPHCSLETGGSCMFLGCSSSRGPTTCINHKCICQLGYCNEEGMCARPEDIADCPRATGGSCKISGCDQSRGEVECVNGQCICKRGFCNNLGICRSDTSLYNQTEPQCLADTGGTCNTGWCHAWRGPATCRHSGLMSLHSSCECKSGTCTELGVCHPNMGTFKADVTPVNLDHPHFPGPQGHVKTALCISGGGTRSMIYALGVLRALEQLGLMGSIDAVSSASGGTWAAALYMFVDGPVDKLLGPATSPSELTMDRLHEKPPNLLAPATVHTSSIASKYLAENIPKPELWTYTISEAILGGFGLADKDAYMAADYEAVERIRRLNPQLRNSKFFIPVRGRPKTFVMCGILMSPTGYAASTSSATSFQMSPDFTGSPFYPNNDAVWYDPLPGKLHPTLFNTIVGGGFVETFAFGGTAPPTGQDGGIAVEMAAPIEPMSLAKAVGVSSDGPSVAVAQATNFVDFTLINALTSMWPVTSPHLPGPQQAFTFQLGDGGNLDNSAIIPMLQRRAERIIALLNSGIPIPSKDFCSAPIEDPVMVEYIKDFEPMVKALFGWYPKNDMGEFINHNQVFPRKELAPLLCELNRLKGEGKPAVILRQMEILENKHWGVRGYSAQIIFSYSEKMANFEAMLPEDTRTDIYKGRTNLVDTGHLRNYPQFAFVLQNPPEGTALTNPQVNLLAAHSEYAVHQNAEVFQQLLGHGMQTSFIAETQVPAQESGISYQAGKCLSFFGIWASAALLLLCRARRVPDVGIQKPLLQ